MASNNRNKNRKKSPNNQPAEKTKNLELSNKEKEDIATLCEETANKVSEQGLTVNAELSEDSAKELQESENKNDLPKYWNYVQKINKNLETLISKAEKEKDRRKKLNDELIISIKEKNSARNDCRKKIEEYNKKDIELTEREFALENGEYTGIIRRLLDTIKDTEKKIFTDTENLLKELSEFHKKNIEEFSTHLQENTKFEKDKANFKREEKKFEVNKKIYEEEIEARYKEKYEEKLEEKKNTIKKLENQLKKNQEKNEELTTLIENIKSAFESDFENPQKLLDEHAKLQQKCTDLENELNERPENEDYNEKIKQINFLKEKLKEEQNKVNQKEFLELQKICNNSDKYIIEINGYKQQIESGNVREQRLQKTIKNLIEYLNGEKEKAQNAFEFAKKCDADENNLGRNQLENNPPPSLKALVEYIQQRMAFHSNEQFYYSTETIRTFLAGLYMSPISILQGISGTGKTSLPREFAKSLLFDTRYIGTNSENKIDNAPYRICAIQSGWRDNMDLMGYYNSFEHKYKETEFFKALYLANQPKYRDTLFFIILDEMNLSHPEHYFADFLSLLEQSAGERYINLTNTPEEVLPARIKGGKLRVPENVRFIGTANHDETTLEFAPKTYDRSNVMELPKNHPNNIKNANIESKYNITYSWLKTQFENAEKTNESYYTKFINFIDSKEIQDLLTEKGIGTGNRLKDQAKRFIGVYLAAGGKLSEAVDHLVTSRLFRTLKNRYDLDEKNLKDFKKNYVEAFEKAFENSKPQIAIELLDSEIKKK